MGAGICYLRLLLFIDGEPVNKWNSFQGCLKTAGQGWIRKDRGRAHGSRRKKVGRRGGVEGKTRQGDKTT